MKSLITMNDFFLFKAEQKVLGGLMLDNEALYRIPYRLSPTDFYSHTHKIIYRTIIELVIDRKPFDVLTLSEALKERQQLDEAGGEQYLFKLIKNLPSSANIVAYADIVRRCSVLRQSSDESLKAVAEIREKQQKKAVERILKNSTAIGYLELVDTRDEKETEID